MCECACVEVCVFVCEMHNKIKKFRSIRVEYCTDLLEWMTGPYDQCMVCDFY